MRRLILLACIPIGAVLIGCAAERPGLERFDPAGWVDLGPVVVESMAGQRRGSEVEATAVFTHGNDRVTLSMQIVLGPPARFVEGNHMSLLEGASFVGPATAESITFLGGQNTDPSVGGVFIIENPAGGTRYRLRMPATLLSRSR